MPNTSCCSPSVCCMKKRVSDLHCSHVFLFNSNFYLCFFLSVLIFLGEFVAQFKFTVLLMANGPHRITTGPLDPEFYKSEHEVQDPELKVRVTLNL